MGTGRITHGRDSVLYVGMNDSSAAQELAAIRQGNPGITPVRTDGPDNVRSKRDDSYFITPLGVKGRHVDLGTAKGRADFVKFLDVPPATAKRIEAVLAKAPKGLRDELAQMAVGWAAAERGDRGPSRLVLSGHSDGDNVWGERGGEDEALTPKLLMELAKAMPRAAAQVEDLAISACSCGGKETVEQWRAAFPNLKTMLAYRTSSPTAEQGSGFELARWEKLTRGGATELAPQGFNPNAATWSVKNGYLTPNTIDVEAARATIQQLEPVYLAVKNGERPVDASTKQQLDRYRTALRELAGADNDTVRPDERADATNRARSVLLALHYDEWKGKFQAKYGGALKDAYRELGLKPPAENFAKMSRKEAMGEIDRVVKAISQAGYPKSLEPAFDALRALRGLDASVLRTSWVQ